MWNIAFFLESYICRETKLKIFKEKNIDNLFIFEQIQVIKVLLWMEHVTY